MKTYIKLERERCITYGKKWTYTVCCTLYMKLWPIWYLNGRCDVDTDFLSKGLFCIHFIIKHAFYLISKFLKSSQSLFAKCTAIQQAQALACMAMKCLTSHVCVKLCCTNLIPQQTHTHTPFWCLVQLCHLLSGGDGNWALSISCI